jgi:hypothetical protein
MVPANSPYKSVKELLEAAVKSADRPRRGDDFGSPEPGGS